VEEEADESGFWLEMLRHISQLGIVEFDSQSVRELGWLEDEANQLVAITVGLRKPHEGVEVRSDPSANFEVRIAKRSGLPPTD
jgi:hypothetical protein